MTTTASTRILFINEDYFKKATTIGSDGQNDPFDSSLLISTIEDAQTMYIEDLLGSGVSDDLQIAQKYGEKIVKYLQENQQHFPRYYNPGSGLDVISPLQSSYLSSIYLPISNSGNITQN